MSYSASQDHNPYPNQLALLENAIPELPDVVNPATPTPQAGRSYFGLHTSVSQDSAEFKFEPPPPPNASQTSAKREEEVEEYKMWAETSTGSFMETSGMSAGFEAFVLNEAVARFQKYVEGTLVKRLALLEPDAREDVRREILGRLETVLQKSEEEAGKLREEWMSERRERGRGVGKQSENSVRPSTPGPSSHKRTREEGEDNAEDGPVDVKRARIEGNSSGSKRR